MEQGISREELSAYFSLRTAGDRLQRAVADQLRGHDLTEVQFTILATLRDAGELRMSDLAHVIVATKNGMTYQAGQLERRNLISRRASDTDARSVLIRIEPAGDALLDEALPGHIAVVRRLLLDRVSARELEAIRSGLAKVTARSS